MSKKLNGEDVSLGRQKAKIGGGKYEMYKNGFYNPVSPRRFNMLTGFEDGNPISKNHSIDYVGNGKVNGKEVNF